MKEYATSSSGIKVALPEDIYQHTADVYFTLTRRRKEEATDYMTVASDDAAAVLLHGFGLEKLVAMKKFIKMSDADHDLVWLGIARESARWNQKHNFREDNGQYGKAIEDITLALEAIAPKASLEYCEAFGIHIIGQDTTVITKDA